MLQFKGSDGNGRPVELPAGTLVMLGVWIALVPTLMLFLSLVSAYAVRQGLAGDWVPVDLPPLLWVNTGVLLGSSATLELARRRPGDGSRGRTWLWVTFILGALFLGGQVIAWRQLLGQGVGLASTPHGSFFYLLTGTHALHLAGGVLALAAAALWPARGWWGVGPVTVVRASAVYWHFVDALWIGLFVLLVFWR